MHVPIDQWRPGRSVAHRAWWAGSIGAFVEPSRKTKKDLGLPLNVPLCTFVSVAHVLAPPGVNANLGDYILSPGPPDVSRTASYRCAKLKNFYELLPPGDGTAPININTHDIAVAVMTEVKQVSNHIPNPTNQDELVMLDGVHSDEEIEKLAADSASVFMFGRKTGFF